MRTKTEERRAYPVGAEWGPAGAHFRVWAPEAERVEAVFESGGSLVLAKEGGGYHSGRAPRARPGTLYRYLLDGKGPFPDPASRFQPQGPHGPSMITDPAAYLWRDGAWHGIPSEGRVIYEMHIGTFTPEGTWNAAQRRLDDLADLGVNVLELMPVCDFPGRFGWGYDGVDLYAPTRLYGTPEDFKAFVDRCHALGLGVILDVVYNHLGPDGNYLREFSRDYFSRGPKTEWGEAINYDGPHSAHVREFFASNARYWIREFHLDGLRLDATQSLFDRSQDHILAELAREARAGADGRSIVLIAENEPQETRLVRPAEEGGYGLDALWNDDFHHAASVAMTGRSEAYYMDYLGTPQELISAVKRGYLYQGQYYRWQRKRRGSSARGLPASAFVLYLDNHDQVANSLYGRRCHQTTSPGRHRAMTALMLLAPGTPMLFQGQEFSASSPFVYFAEHHPELSKAVREGRREYLTQFLSMKDPDIEGVLADPASAETFRRCKLDHSERALHADALALHRDLLKLRREDPVLGSQRGERLEGAVLGPEAFVLRFYGEEESDRLLTVNLGPDLLLSPAPEPLLAAPEGWEVLWSSENVRYGGGGVFNPVNERQAWVLAGHAATVLRSR